MIEVLIRPAIGHWGGKEYQIKSRLMSLNYMNYSNFLTGCGNDPDYWTVSDFVDESQTGNYDNLTLETDEYKIT